VGKLKAENKEKEEEKEKVKKGLNKGGIVRFLVDPPST
jgi:hypothetical protein